MEGEAQQAQQKGRALWKPKAAARFACPTQRRRLTGLGVLQALQAGHSVEAARALVLADLAEGGACRQNVRLGRRWMQ